MLVLAMMELVAHDMHDPNNEASVKDGKERCKSRKISGSIVQSPNPLLHSLTDQARPSIDRNPLAQPSSLTSLSPVAPLLSYYHLFLQPLLSYRHSFQWGRRVVVERQQIAVGRWQVLKRSPPKLGPALQGVNVCGGSRFFGTIPSLSQWPHLITGINRH